MSTFNISQKLSTPPADVAVAFAVNGTSNIYVVPANSLYKVGAFISKDNIAAATAVLVKVSPSGVKIDILDTKVDASGSQYVCRGGGPDAARIVEFINPLVLPAGWALAVRVGAAGAQTRNFAIMGEFIENTL